MTKERDAEWKIEQLKAQYLVETEEVEVGYLRTNPTVANLKAWVNSLGNLIEIVTVNDDGQPGNAVPKHWKCTANVGDSIIVALLDGNTEKARAEKAVAYGP